jgi:5-methylcytosine-specific restriction endonuclease McrA
LRGTIHPEHKPCPWCGSPPILYVNHDEYGGPMVRVAVQCFECGEDAEQTHHVVPMSQGGTKTVPLCKRCHTLAHRNGMGTLSHIGRARETWKDEARARLEAKGIK